MGIHFKLPLRHDPASALHVQYGMISGRKFYEITCCKRIRSCMCQQQFRLRVLYVFRKQRCYPCFNKTNNFIGIFFSKLPTTRKVWFPKPIFIQFANDSVSNISPCKICYFIEEILMHKSQKSSCVSCNCLLIHIFFSYLDLVCDSSTFCTFLGEMFYITILNSDIFLSSDTHRPAKVEFFSRNCRLR